jgi:type IV secretory pathway VirB4 component
VSVPAHRATTAHLGSAYPFMSEAGLCCEGVLVGRDLLGGSFSYDPFELYAKEVVTDPNMVVIGQIGRGKSAFVKSYLWRQSVFGRRAWVVDPKGEYGPLAEAWGVEVVRLRPGGTVRLNPLDHGTGQGEDAGRRRTELLCALASASLGRGLHPGERVAVELAVDSVSKEPDASPTIPQVVEALLSPSAVAGTRIHTSSEVLATDGRDVALELRRLVTGDLRGMFDGPTSRGIRLDASLVVLDLSAVYASPALGVLMACATAFLSGAVEHDRGRRIVVVDEAWAILANLGVARWLRSSWKLSRAHGASNVAVLHRLSDLASAGPAGSEQAQLASGLLSDSQTLVVYGQPPGEVVAARELLGLTATEADLLPRLRRGVALWKVGRRSFLVEHRLAPAEHGLVGTDSCMAP